MPGYACIKYIYQRQLFNVLHRAADYIATLHN